MSATFRFGAGDVHEFRVECDLIGGERYFVDDVLLEKRWSLSAGDSREFETDGHRIRIVLRATSKEVVSEVYASAAAGAGSRADAEHTTASRSGRRCKWSVVGVSCFTSF